MELGPVENELTVPPDVRRKGKNEHLKINGWVNGRHIACHSEWHNISATVGSGHWYKNWPYLKSAWSFGLSHVESATRKQLAAECQLTYQEVKILTCGQYPNITPYKTPPYNVWKAKRLHGSLPNSQSCMPHHVDWMARGQLIWVAWSSALPKVVEGAASWCTPSIGAWDHHQEAHIPVMGIPQRVVVQSPRVEPGVNVWFSNKMLCWPGGNKVIDLICNHHTRITRFNTYHRVRVNCATELNKTPFISLATKLEHESRKQIP